MQCILYHSSGEMCCLCLQGSRWRQDVHLKCWCLSTSDVVLHPTRLHCSQSLPWEPPVLYNSQMFTTFYSATVHINPITKITGTFTIYCSIAAPLSSMWPGILWTVHIQNIHNTEVWYWEGGAGVWSLLRRPQQVSLYYMCACSDYF
jgi:hypothetical protein